MKKPFSRRRNALLQNRAWLGPTSLALVGVLLLIVGIRVFFPGVIASVTTPLWQSGTMLSAGAGNSLSFFNDRATLVEERARLEAENAALATRIAVLEARTQDLATLLGTRTEAQGGVLASVLARPPVSPYDVLVVDQGIDAGVVVGAQAHGPGGVPLGTVESVTNTSARILLYSAPNKETEAWVGEARIPITLVGHGSGTFDAIVAREAGIAVGDMVYVAGEGALPIGTIVAVDVDPSSPRTPVRIRPMANPFSVMWVTLMP